MTTSVHNYRIWCVTESAYVYTWGTETPTVCPNNPAHTIDANSITIVETVSTNAVTAEENSNGYFETTHIIMNVPVGTPGDIVTQDITWPMDILLWKTLLTPTSDMIGDVISVLASPETTVGVATAPVNIGVTTINVNSTVTANTQRGFLITLDDGVNKDVCGRCTAVDANAGTISFQTATVNSFTAGTPVKISVYVLNNIRIIDTNIIDIGGKGFKGKTIPVGLTLRIYYTNNSGTSKTVVWRAEYYANG